MKTHLNVFTANGLCEPCGSVPSGGGGYSLGGQVAGRKEARADMSCASRRVAFTLSRYTSQFPQYIGVSITTVSPIDLLIELEVNGNNKGKHYIEMIM